MRLNICYTYCKITSRMKLLCTNIVKNTQKVVEVNCIIEAKVTNLVL